MVNTNDRSLLTIETISAIEEIPNADAIAAAKIRGWTVVVRKGEMAVGDQVIYFEIDSLLPLDDERFAFLASRGEKVVDNKRFHRLKTACLRGCYSQGLILPINQFNKEITEYKNLPNNTIECNNWLAARLGIEKYEMPIPVGSGNILGAFPSRLARKTDSERIQNISNETWVEIQTDRYLWLATEKIDGTSVTYACDIDGQFHVAGRNWEIADGDNLYWNVARLYNIDKLLQPGEVVQGEIYGDGIQGNPLKVNEKHLAIFNYTINGAHKGRHWPKWIDEKKIGIPIYDIKLPNTIDECLLMSDDLHSLINSQCLAEGIVWVNSNGREIAGLNYRSTFKVISNKYLLKHE